MSKFNKGDLVFFDSEEHAAVMVFWRDRAKEDSCESSLFNTRTLNPGTPDTIVTYLEGGDHISDVMFSNGRIGWLITRALRRLEE